MLHALAQKVRNRITREALQDESGFGLPEAIMAMLINSATVAVVAGILMSGYNYIEIQKSETEAQHTVDRIAVAIDEEVRTSAGIARTDKWDTAMWLRQTDGTCTRLSVENGALTRTNFIMFGTSERVNETEVLEEGIVAVEGTPFFTPTTAGVHSVMDFSNERATQRADVRAIPDVLPTDPIDAVCSFVP